MKKCAVLGGGISGLSTAYYLKKAGYQVHLYEAKDTGGKISSEIDSTNTVFDWGPNTIRDKDGGVLELIKELSIQDEVIEVDDAFKTRCIVRDRKIHTIKTSPLSMLASPIVSLKGKFRILSEFFRHEKVDGDPSIVDFLSQRFGKEVVDYLIDPVFSGIYAGNIHRMSSKEILPDLLNFVNQNGSILKGFIQKKKHAKQQSGKAIKIFNFKKGMQYLSHELSEELKECIIPSEVKQLTLLDNDQVEVNTLDQSDSFDVVISCIPAYALSVLLADIDTELAKELKTIHYPTVMVTQLLFEADSLPLLPRGFGFLVPQVEQMKILGCIWKSSLFPQHTPDNRFLFTIFSGGAHHQIHQSDVMEMEKSLLNEFKELMEIHNDPISVKSKLWEKALPQFHVGYAEVRDKINNFEKTHPNIVIGGNFRWGVSVPDCIKNARSVLSVPILNS